MAFNKNIEIDIKKIILPCIENLNYNDLLNESSVEKIARRLLLDTLGCAISGWKKNQPKKILKQLGSRESGSIIFPGTPALSETAAAYIIAVGACWDEACGGLAAANGRPGLHVVPVALALGMEKPFSEVLKAIIIGYEIAARAGIVLKIKSSMHVDGTWGAFGSVASYLENKEILLNSLYSIGCQLTQSLYLPVIYGSTIRNLYAGRCVADAIRLVSGLALGISSPPKLEMPEYIFEYDNSYTFPSKHWYILDSYFKKYAGARHLHYGVEAALRFNSLGIGPEKITSITLEIYNDALKYCGNRRPKSRLQAQFSLSYGIAHVIMHGHLNPSAFEGEALNDIEVMRIENLIQIKSFPSQTRIAKLIVRTIEKEIVFEVKNISGDPECPLSDSDLIKKFVEYSESTLGNDSAKKIANSIIYSQINLPLRKVIYC